MTHSKLSGSHADPRSVHSGLQHMGHLLSQVSYSTIINNHQTLTVSLKIRQLQNKLISSQQEPKYGCEKIMKFLPKEQVTPHGCQRGTSSYQEKFPDLVATKRSCNVCGSKMAKKTQNTCIGCSSCNKKFICNTAKMPLVY